MTRKFGTKQTTLQMMQRERISSAKLCRLEPRKGVNRGGPAKIIPFTGFKTQK